VLDRRVAARVEYALVVVVPADAVTLVRHLAQHLENLADSLRFAYVMARDHDEVSSSGCMCVLPTEFSFDLGGPSMQRGVRRDHRGNY